MEERVSIPHCSVLWTAYNEEFTLEHSVSKMQTALNYACLKLNQEYDFDISFHGLICHNGCTDNTARIAEQISKRSINSNFKIDVIESPKGMVVAQHAGISYFKQLGYHFYPIFFIDCDALICHDSVFLMLEQLVIHPSLKAVGAHPIPLNYKGFNPYKNFLFNVLNCRAFFPKSEVAVNPDSSFHPYSRSDPQPVGYNFEEKSKIYFHGRCFVIRNIEGLLKRICGCKPAWACDPCNAT